MEAVHAETGETVYLCVQRGLDAVCIERLDGERVQTLALVLGGSLPLHMGAAPRVLLAFQPRASWHRYIGELEADGDRAPRLAKRELFERLEAIRATGYEISDGDVTDGIAAIGAPIFDYQGNLCGSLSISGTRPAILDNAPASIERITEAAKRASRALGAGITRGL
jgi:DNA-binding IclR family transcriptional regulator